MILESRLGNTHVHVPLIKDGTARMVKSAILSGLNFMVLVYDTQAERFDRFADRMLNPVIPGHVVTNMGEITRIGGVTGVFYAIKGQQITAEIDLLAWPIKKPIDPNGKSLVDICEEIKAQDALVVLPHPRQDQREKIDSIKHYLDAVEYNCAPELFVYDSNRIVQLFPPDRYPTIAGSDERMPKGIIPFAGGVTACTRLKRCVKEDFDRLDTQQKFMDYFRAKMRAGEVDIEKKHVPLADFMVQYAFYAATMMRKEPVNVIKSFYRSHLG